MRINPAVRHDQRVATGQTFDIMGADSAAGKFIDAYISKRHVPDTNTPDAVGIVIFGRVKQAPVGGKSPVPVEVPPLGRVQRGLDPPRHAVDHQCEIAGAPCKGDSLRLGRMRRRRVAATGQGDFEHHLKRRVDTAEHKAAVAQTGSGKIGRPTRIGPSRRGHQS